MDTFWTASRNAWTRQLSALAARPLASCPDFPVIARRWEAWWRFEAVRPLLVAAAPKRRDIRWDKAFDLLTQPAAWLEVRRRQMDSLHWVDATVPSIRVDLGPVVTGAILGAPLQFAPTDDTSWQTPIIDAWQADSVPAPDPQNHWLQVMLALARATAADAAGRYLVCLPDLSGAVDVLANLRGSERLLLDLYDAPEAVLRGAERALAGWELAFRQLYDAILGAGAGPVSWLHAWSNTPYTVPTCDFNYMISREQFIEFCLPTLAAQAQRAGRCLFHLDGPGASKHAATLAAEPSITAVQYTPGAGTPSALAKLEMLRELQAAGKPIAVMCPQSEVAALVDALDHRGLVLIPQDIATPQQADRLWNLVAR